MICGYGLRRGGMKTRERGRDRVLEKGKGKMEKKKKIERGEAKGKGNYTDR